MLSVCAILVFYDTVFRNGVLLTFWSTLVNALYPVIYGAAMAYLLAPIVNFFDRCILKLTDGKGKRGLIRAGSILAAWLVVFLMLYALMSSLIPQLISSVATLAGNMQTYYRTVYGWVEHLLETNPDIASRVTEMIGGYYTELRSWFTGTLLPQAQQTITIVTGGVVTVLVFFKNFFVGVIISIYLLALKERLALQTKKLLYAFASEPRYRGILRATRRIDTISAASSAESCSTR